VGGGHISAIVSSCGTDVSVCGNFITSPRLPTRVRDVVSFQLYTHPLSVIYTERYGRSIYIYDGTSEIISALGMGNRDKNFQLSPPGRLLAICFHTAWRRRGHCTEETYRIMLYIQDVQLRAKKLNAMYSVRNGFGWPSVYYVCTIYID
jgi:hypothetical protein